MLVLGKKGVRTNLLTWSRMYHVARGYWGAIPILLLSLIWLMMGRLFIAWMTEGFSYGEEGVILFVTPVLIGFFLTSICAYVNTRFGIRLSLGEALSRVALSGIPWVLGGSLLLILDYLFPQVRMTFTVPPRLELFESHRPLLERGLSFSVNFSIWLSTILLYGYLNRTLGLRGLLVLFGLSLLVFYTVLLWSTATLTMML